jgi:hypothetical protein
MSKAIPIQNSTSTTLLLQTLLTSSPSSLVRQTHKILRFPRRHPLPSLRNPGRSPPLHLRPPLQLPPLPAGLAPSTLNPHSHDTLFLHFTGCTTSILLGYIVPYFYIPTYARERPGSSDSLALYMLVFAIAGSFFGRLLSGVLVITLVRL